MQTKMKSYHSYVNMKQHIWQWEHWNQLNHKLGQQDSWLLGLIILWSLCVCESLSPPPPNFISLRWPPSQELQPLVEWPHPRQAWVTAWIQRQWVHALLVTHKQTHSTIYTPQHCLNPPIHVKANSTQTTALKLIKAAHTLKTEETQTDRSVDTHMLSLIVWLCHFYSMLYSVYQSSTVAIHPHSPPHLLSICLLFCVVSVCIKWGACYCIILCCVPFDFNSSILPFCAGKRK